MVETALIIFACLVAVIALYLIARPGKKDIKLDMYEVPGGPDQQSEEIVQALRERGKEATYEQNGRFVIDGDTYVMQTGQPVDEFGFSYEFDSYGERRTYGKILLTRVEDETKRG